MSPKLPKDPSLLEERLDYRFKKPLRLVTALTHRSYANENPQSGHTDNERFEFLGDAVLDLCVSDLLINAFPDSDEGVLSKIRAGLVNEKPLADMALSLELGQYLHLGRGEEASGGRTKESLLANAMEALIAAIYLDAGYTKTRAWVRRRIGPALRDPLMGEHGFDYKSALQEHCQKMYKRGPVYSLLNTSGPDHEQTFEVSVVLEGVFNHTGCGRSKKDAQKQAARQAWEWLHHDN